MLTVALQHCGLDPSFAIGGDLATSGSGAHEGTGDIFVVEADESDASFLAYSPEVAIVTNIEADHLDHYGSPAAYVAAFDEFLGRIAPGGTLVTCVDDPGAAALADTARGRGIRVRTYGRAEGVDARLVAFRPDGAGGRIVLSLDGAEHRLRLPVPGEHMALNALAALLAGVALGAPAEGLLEGLAGFDGVRRRFEFRGRAAGVAVYDDYAHHPTKVAAQLRAARDVAGAGRVVVAFQPHLYSRTREFAREFGAALGLADEVVVLDVYGAREDPEPGVSGALVAENVPLAPEHVRFVPRWAEVPAVVRGHGALRRPRDHDGRGRRHGARAGDPAGAVAMNRPAPARPVRRAGGPDQRAVYRRRRVAAAIVAVFLIGALGLVVRVVLYDSRLLDVQGVQVEGISTLPETDIVRAAAVPIGAPLASIATGDVANRVAQVPAVATAVVRGPGRTRSR